MTEINGRIPRVNKIAVLRANALGDFIVTLPALESLRAAYPGAEIVLLGKEWHRSFLAERPGPVDRVEVVPPYAGVSEADGCRGDDAAVEKFFERMRAEGFDLALQFQGGGRNSNPFIRRLGARVTVGSRTPDAEPLDRSIPYIYLQPEILRYLELAALAGAAPVSYQPQLALTSRDLAEARAALRPDGRPTVVLHPGVGKIDRRWPPDKFAAVGDALAREGARIVVTGSAWEAPLVRATIAAMQAEALDLSGRLSLGGLVGLLADAALIVTNDTGPRHVAEAIGTPSVAIYWCFNLINSGPVTRGLHRPLVSWTLDCPVCGTNQSVASCEHAVSHVADIPIGDVLLHALDLLKGAEGGESRHGLCTPTLDKAGVLVASDRHHGRGTTSCDTARGRDKQASACADGSAARQGEREQTGGPHIETETRESCIRGVQATCAQRSGPGRTRDDEDNEVSLTTVSDMAPCNDETPVS